jgi:hypothetical protein
MLVVQHLDIDSNDLPLTQAHLRSLTRMYLM